MKARALGISIVVPAIVALVFAGQAAAQTAARPELIETGWWSDALGATNVDGGTTVGASPDGGASISAFRIQTANGLTSATLELTEASTASATIGGVSACIAPNDWRAVEQGPIEDAPLSECDNADSVPVVRDDVEETWSVDLGPTLAGRTGEVSVVFVPDPARDDSGLGGVVPWSVSWAPDPVFSFEAADPREPAETTQTTTTVPRPAVAPATPAPHRPSSTVAPAITVAPYLSGLPTTTSIAPPTTEGIAENFAAASTLGDGAGGRPIGQALFFLSVSALAGTMAGGGRWFLARRNPR